jgi:hypothetical protein
MTVSIAPIESGDDLARSEDDFFREIVRTRSASPHQDWENRANAMGELLPGEVFRLRFIEKNFDGAGLGRWIVFCEKPPCSIHPGRSRIITVMTVEMPGEVGSFADPSDAHLDALRMVLRDWREGRHAAIQRMEEMREEEDRVSTKNAIDQAHGHVDDIFWIWKRAMGESVNLRLGSDGKGPNHGGKHFGGAFQREDAAERTEGGIILP